MKRLNHLSLIFWLIVVTGLIITLTGCDITIAAPVITTALVQNTATT